MRMTAIACGLLFSAQVAAAATLHVPADYPTIQQAINASTSGDIVLVAAGTYNERISIAAAQDGVKVLSESGAAATIIDGGYTGTVVSIVGVGSGTELGGFTITHGGPPDPPFHNGGGLAISGSPKIDNDIITGNTAQFGGGIYVSGSPLITHCVVDGNTAVQDPTFQGGGGGIYVTGSPTITDNSITNNQLFGIDVENPVYADIENNLIQGNSQYAGLYWHGNQPLPGVVKNNQFVSNVGLGMVVSIFGGLGPPGDPPVIQGNLFQSNSSGGLSIDAGSGSVESNQFLSNTGAPALYANGSGVTIHGNLFQDNENLGGPGGAIYLFHANDTIDQNVILRNHSSGGGGGIAVAASTATITGNTIALNRSDQGGGNVYFVQGSALTLQHNIFSHSPNVGVQRDNSQGANTVTMSCNDASNNAGGNYTGMPDPTGTNGNIALDPMYCNLLALDVHIASSSPCAAANSPSGCGLIGALDVNCDGPVRTEPTTWGRMKARYR